jgi:hypothetical protein
MEEALMWKALILLKSHFAFTEKLAEGLKWAKPDEY